MKLVIVLPTYNEADNISLLFEKIFSLEINNIDITLLIVDDNSPDETGKLAEELSTKYNNNINVIHRKSKLGLGSAYIEGFKWAINNGADFIGQMDSDLSHPPEKLIDLLEKTNQYDVVIGSRYINGGGVDRQWPYWRKGLSIWGNFYARSILNLKTKDVTSGFRIWKTQAIENLPLNLIKSNGYVFLVELLFLAKKFGYHIGEIPFYFSDRTAGKSKMNFKIQFEAAWRVWYLLYYYWKNPV